MLMHEYQTQPIQATEFSNPKYKQNGTKYNAYKNVKKKKKGNHFQSLLVTQTPALSLTIMT